MTFYAMERRGSSADRRQQTMAIVGRDRRIADRRRTSVHALIWRTQRRSG